MDSPDHKATKSGLYQIAMQQMMAEETSKSMQQVRATHSVLQHRS
jgi:hypothetical protein